MRRTLVLALALLTLAGPAFAFSGSGAVTAMKSGDFKVRYFNGTQAGVDSALLYCASGGYVQVGAGTYTRTIPLKVGANTTLAGLGRQATVFTASAGFTGTAMIMPADTTGAQQWCSVVDLMVDGNSGGGAVVSRGILFKGVGQPSRIANVLVTGVSGVGIWREGVASNAASVEILNSSVTNCGHHNAVVTGSSGMTTFIDFTTENPGANAAALFIDGVTSGIFPSSVSILGLHIEGLASGETGLWIDDAQGINASGIAYYGSGATGTLVKVTGSAGTCRGITLQNIFADGSAVALVVDDQVYGHSLNNANRRFVPIWTTDKGTNSRFDVVTAAADTVLGGTLEVGGGSVINKILRGSATLDFDLTAVVSQGLTITVTGAAVGDECALGVPNGSVTADTIFYAWVSATNTVTVRATRVAGTPNPASGTFKVTVIQ